MGAGGAFAHYFTDAPTLLNKLATGRAPLVSYFWIGVFTFTTYDLADHMREQVCLYTCPCPRIQAALIDSDALGVTHRRDRGEPRMSVEVKVFGCRLACENRPSTNARACVSDLWGFRVLPERDDGGVGSAITLRGKRRARLCARRSGEAAPAARNVHAMGQCLGERRADGGRRNNRFGRCFRDLSPDANSQSRKRNFDASDRAAFCPPSRARTAQYDHADRRHSV